MRLVLENFAGIAPKINQKKLSDEMATEAQNTRLDRGTVASWKALAATGDSVPAGTQSIFLYGDNWLAWPTDVDVVERITANDVRERIVYTGDDYPKIRSGNEEYRLGIPRPGATTASVTIAGDKTSLVDVRNQSYRVSFVDGWGAEGPLSDPSNTVEVGLDGEVEVTLPAVPTGDYNFATAARKRIYRSNTGIDSGIWQMVSEVPMSQASFADSVNPGDLQEAAITETWIGPPDDDTTLYPEGALQHLTMLPSGILAGFTGNVVCFSYPYVPHAWPADFRVTIPDGTIVGIASLYNGVLVCTDKKPYLLQGSSPDSILPLQLDSHQACSSQRSIVDMGGYAIYASPDGLCLADGSSVQLVTEQFFSKHEWAEFEPDTIRAWLYEGKYFARFGSGDRGFVYDPVGDTRSFSTLDWPVEAAYLSVQDDSLFVAKPDGTLHRFDAGDHLTYVWQSKEFVLPNRVGLSVLRVEAEDYPVTIRLIGDGRTILERPVLDAKPVRIPSGTKSKNWQVRVSSNHAVEMIVLADAMAEVV